MTHWAMRFYERHYGYEAGAAGPDTFDCWGLVRWVEAEHFARDLPAIALPDEAGFAEIRGILRAHGWRATHAPRDGDGVVMRAPNGDLHVGVHLDLDGGRTLHCVEGVGVVVSTPLQLTLAGFGGGIEHYTPTR